MGMGILGGNPKDEPMHYGEIFDVWSFSSKARMTLSCYQAYLNHAGDQDLQDMLKDLINQARQEMKECDKILLDNGLAPPPTLPERPEVKAEDIPVGARFADQEIAMHLAADLSMSLVACSQSMSMCTREDVAAMFAKYHATKTAFAGRILRLNKEKGWLVPPPLHMKKPELVEV